MSVAFRRESDEEHLEPRFELPIPSGPNFVTARGLAQAGAKVDALTAAVAVAAACDAEAAKPLQRELRYWRTRLATARLAPPPPPGEAGIGSLVAFSLDGTERRVAIVGHDEAEPAAAAQPGAARLAFTAPLARALIGAAAGDRIDFAGRAEAIEILSVGPQSD